MSEETEKEVPEKEVPKEEEAPKEEKRVSSVDEANEVLRKMEAANVKAEEILGRQEALRAEQILSGKSEAGSADPVVDKEQAIKDRANERLKDTGLSI